MKQKPDASWNADSTERRGVRKSLTRAGVQLGYAVTGALTSSLEALEERLESGASPASGGTAQDRMRELLSRDRAALHARGGRSVRPSLAGPDEYGFAGKPSGGTARGRMRELLSQDRAQLATLDDEPFSELFEEAEQSGTMALPPAARASSAPAPAPVVAPPAPVVPAVSVMKAPVIVGSDGLQNGFVSGRVPAASALPPAPAPAGRVAVAVFDPGSTQLTAVAPAAPRAASPSFAVFSPAPAPVSAPEAAPAVVVAAVPEAKVAAPEAVPAAAPAPSAPEARVEPAAPAKKAMPSLPNKTPVGSAPVAAPVEDGGDSPIRTRSMARLLALQGYRDKALAIYDDLIAAEPDNADLRAEADRLRG